MPSDLEWIEEMREAVRKEDWHTKDYKSGALHALDAVLERLADMKRRLEADDE